MSQNGRMTGGLRLPRMIRSKKEMKIPTKMLLMILTSIRRSLWYWRGQKNVVALRAFQAEGPFTIGYSFD